MRPSHQQLIPLLAVFALPTWGQQFEGVVRGVEYPGLSDACLDALNTTVPYCPALLASASVDTPRLDADQLRALCTADCRAALASSRKTIAAGCRSPSDTIELSDGVVYPATFFIDRFIYTYDLSCRRDRTSGRYCDEQFVLWLAAGNASTSAANCSDCSLGVMQIQLNSPFGYDDDFANEFKSATASCSAADYSFTSPSSYAIRTDLPNPGDNLSTPSCSSPYLVPPGDSCDAISLSKGVSTYSIIRAGGLRDCRNLAAGSSLCLPSPCSLYRVQEGDDCASVVARYPGVTRESLLSWNPNINPICTNIADLVGTFICLSPPGGNASDVTITAAPPATTSAAPTAVPRPTNSHPNTTAPCADWYTVQDGDNCETISIRQNIGLEDFYFLNPSIDANCTNLWLDTAYCVQAVGDISTYPGYPHSTTSPLYTLTPSSFATTSTTLSRTAPSVTPIVALPLAPGTRSDCEAYVEYIPVDPFRDQAQSQDGRLVTSRINSCEFASSGYPVSVEDFLSWNPSLVSLSPCYLQPGYSYCALNSSSVVVPSPPDGNCLAVTAPYPGTIPTCSCFTTVMGADAIYTTCTQVAQDAGISLSDLTAWNPWIFGNSNLLKSCEAGLFAGLSGTQERAVCIGVSSSSSSAAASSSPVPSGTRTTAASASTTSSTASGGGGGGSSITAPSPPAPTQTGIVAGCTRYYVAQLGDGCWGIAHQFGIALDQFLAWNPAVGSDCKYLWPDYAYCVAAI